ncbi:unnamed protein product [Enterobius vermicularis]|uniref:G_PROTEIN_RECEP_F1_2 domain-containing protein n=1 Tax=Enterobius vermicularis TaxID=51028 RepID=A0A0N4VH81_ENTVE|nr:unnamed protein product [Enterobius vermicularis]
MVNNNFLDIGSNMEPTTVFSLEDVKRLSGASWWMDTVFRCLVLVFWGPLVVMMISYIFIAVRLLQYSMTDPCKKIDNLKKPTEAKYVAGQPIQNNESMFSDGGLEKSRGSIDQKNVDYDESEYSLKSNKQTSKQASSYCFKNVCCVDASEEESLDTSLYQFFFLGATPRRSTVPVWRRQLRSRVFRTTLLVVITHITFWFPYNLYSIMRYIDVQLYEQMSDHANVFKDLQIVIALVNPFLYGFST